MGLMKARFTCSKLQKAFQKELPGDGVKARYRLQLALQEANRVPKVRQHVWTARQSSKIDMVICQRLTAYQIQLQVKALHSSSS